MVEKNAPKSAASHVSAESLTGLVPLEEGADAPAPKTRRGRGRAKSAAAETPDAATAAESTEAPVEAAEAEAPAAEEKPAKKRGSRGRKKATSDADAAGDEAPESA